MTHHILIHKAIYLAAWLVAILIAAFVPLLGLLVMLFVGGFHAVELNRSMFWGLAAMTGIGALILLFMPMKKG